MTGIQSRVRQLSLSIAGILVVILFVGTACVPEELRADVASRMVGLAEGLDATLTDAWHLAFSPRGSDHPAVASADHKGGASHPAALTGAQAPMATSGGSGLIVMNGIGSGTFNAAYGAGSASNSMAGLLSDVFKENDLGANGGFEAFGTSFAGSTSAPHASGGGGNSSSAGMGGSAGGSAPAGLSHPSSNTGMLNGHAASDGATSEGNVRLASVKPSAQNLYPDAHPGGTVNPESGFASLPHWADASSNQVRSNDPLNASGGGQGVNDRNSWSHGRSASNLDPTTGDPTSPLLNGLDHPLRGEDSLGSGFENGANGGVGSGPGDGQTLEFNDTPASGGHREDHGSLLDKPADLISSVPEPGSLALLSLGLGAIILWRQFRSAP